MVLTCQDLARDRQLLGECGGKGRNLFLLGELGFAVPTFVVIPYGALARELADLEPVIGSTLRSLAAANDAQLLEAAEQITARIEERAFSPSFAADLRHKVAAVFGAEERFSVRSSAAIEDQAEASFAGMFDSYLDVAGEDLLGAVGSCLASAFNARTLKYKQLKGIALDDVRMAVVVQRMIASDRSGVLFTMNAGGNLNETLICAAHGSGEGVVQGAVTTDDYRVDRKTRTVRTAREAAPASGGRRGVLSDAEAQQLTEIGLDIERHFGAPQDIEFTFDRGGSLHLLQSRPITTIQLDRLSILDNSNIVESYPGLTLPLTFSVAKGAYRQVFTSAARAFGFPAAEIRRLDPQLSEMIALVKGRVYYQLQNWYPLVKHIHTSERSLRAWEAFLGVHYAHIRAERIPVLTRWRTLTRIAYLLVNHGRACRSFFRTFEASYRNLRDGLTEAAAEPRSAAALFTLFERETANWFANWGTTIVNDLFAFRSLDALRGRVASYGFDADLNLANDLLCGTEGVESERPLLLLLDLKADVERDPALRQLLAREPTEALERLRQGDFPTFYARFEGYLDRYGDRTLEELKLESPNLRMRPELLLGLIRNNLDNPTTPGSFKEQQQRIRRQAEATVASRQSVLSPRTWLFRIVLGFARETVKQRENMRFARTRAFGVAKELFLEIGSMMASDGLVDVPRDVYYLDLDAVRSYALQGSLRDWQAHVEQQKRRYLEDASLTLPDRIMFAGDRFPDFEPAPRSSRAGTTTLRGLAIFAGEVSATALVLERPDLDRRCDNRILVTRMTDPGWVFLMAQADGIISEKGSLLSHTAIVGRELGIPTIVDVEGATEVIATGTSLRMNASPGLIELLDVASGDEGTNVVPGEQAQP